jgi:tetratricopeptide (TPR) repeat protein
LKKLGAEIEPNPYRLFVNVDRLIAESVGYVQLDMLYEAEALLNQVPPSEAAAHLTAQNILLQIHISRSQNELAADIGTRLILEGPYDAQTIVLTMCALSFIGRTKEGRDVLQLVEQFGRPIAAHAYQMACFDSLAGNFSNALRWLQIELQKPRYFSQRSIGDSDLFPLWRWLGSSHLSLQDAHRLLQIDLEGHCVAASDPNADIQLDENDVKGLPEEFRDLFRFNFTAGIFELSPGAVAKMPVLARNFRKSRARHVTRIASMIRAGKTKALDIVLNAQPKYAAEKAATGNHLGMRYHIVWALAQKRELIGMFYAQADVCGLYDLLDSLSEVQRIDPSFCARMECAADVISADLEEAWKLLDATPRAVRDHPLFQLRQAMAYGRDTDYERALPIYLKLCEIWPHDAVGFANASGCLMKLGRWEGAQAVLDRAPQCYQAFYLYHSQRENMRQRNLDCSPPKTVPFRGQPDLGALLLASEPLLKSQALAVSPSENIEKEQALMALPRE